MSGRPAPVAIGCGDVIADNSSVNGFPATAPVSSRWPLARAGQQCVCLGLSHVAVCSLVTLILSGFLVLYTSADCHGEGCEIFSSLRHSSGCKNNPSCSNALTDIRQYNFTISPGELALRSRDVSRLSNGISRIIHQMWRNHSVPEHNVAWIRSWRRYHPDWLHVFWTDSDLRAFISRDHPEHLDLYDSYPRAILKSDMVRYLLMCSYGGLYVDLDFEAHASLEQQLSKYGAYLIGSPYEWEDVQNSLMASRPNHPFWPFVMRYLYERRPGFTLLSGPVAMNSTGPQVLSDALSRWTFLSDQDNVSKLFLNDFTRWHHADHIWLHEIDRANIGGLSRMACAMSSVVLVLSLVAKCLQLVLCGRSDEEDSLGKYSKISCAHDTAEGRSISWRGLVGGSRIGMSSNASKSGGGGGRTIDNSPTLSVCNLEGSGATSRNRSRS